MADDIESETPGDITGDIDDGDSFVERARRAAAEIRDEESQRSTVIDAAEQVADEVIGSDPD